MACTTEVTRSDEARWPAASEVSVETAQKRAYANNCWSVLLRMRDQRRATDFIAEMAALARTDTLVLVSSCIRRHGCCQPGFLLIPCTQGKTHGSTSCNACRLIIFSPLRRTIFGMYHVACVQEVMCYLLIEPCKTTACTERDIFSDGVHGKDLDTYQNVSHTLLSQV